MYSQNISDRDAFDLGEKVGLKLKRYRRESCREIAESLEGAFDGKRRTRDLTTVEQSFIRNEQLMCSVDFMYWALRYAKIKTKAPGPPRYYEPWESQQLLHDLMAELEETTVERNDGIMLSNLKSRQLGMSTVYEMVLSHKAFFTHGFTGLIAADESTQSEYLFNMMERVYDHNPWWLKPKREYHVKGTQMFFDEMDSLIVVQYGNLKADIGRGKTIHGVHLSELEKWEDTDQIDDGLMPALPRLPSTMAFFESTGEFRGSWWHSFFNDTTDGANRFTPFFVPWYAERNTYTRPAPDDWKPDEITAAHERRVREDSPKWMRGKTVDLSKSQLYFWEFTRKEYAKKGNTGIFFCEYASSPQEAFRSANSSVFSWETLDFLRSKSSYPSSYEVIGPKIDHEKIRLEQLQTRKARTRHV